MTTVVHPGDSLSKRERLVYIFVLGALTCLGPFTIDLYLPAFPLVQHELHTTAAAVQLTLAATTTGFGIGQLIVGPWSDKVGRRLPLIIATSLHILASLGVALAPDVVSVGVFRVLQGMGAAGGGVVAVAMVRDLFGGLPLVRMLSRLSLISGLAPIIAPVIGSQLLRIVDWRGIFFSLAGYGILVFGAAIFFIVETQRKERRDDLGHRTARERYRALFKDRIYIGVCIIAGMTFSGVFGYLASSSFLFQEVYHFSAQQFGLLFAINSVGVATGVQLSSRLAKVLGPQWILAFSTALMFLMGVAIVLVDYLQLGLVALLVPLWFYIFGVGMCFPCQQALALAEHGGEAATAASVMGAINFGLVALSSPIIGLFPIHNAIPMGLMMVATGLVAILTLWFVVRPRRVPALVR